MLRRFYLKKIMVATLALFAIVMLYLMPSNTDNHELSTDKVEYVYNNKSEILYLLDSHDYVARTVMAGCDCDSKEEARDVIEGLTIDGKKSNIIPNGFRSILPAGTSILGLDLKDKILTINFSRELLDINSSYEEKMIEAIVYTLTSIDGIEKVIIKVDGKVLNKLPNSGKSIPEVLDRSFGINKKYDIVNTNNIDSYTIYYVGNFNNNEYYVPVTKYVNSKGDDKVKVIIDELSSSPIHETNLMSYLDANVSLIDYDLSDDILKLNFSNSILDNSTSNKILEEVVYTISLSVQDNYRVKEVDFLVEDKEIYKKSLKSLE